MIIIAYRRHLHSRLRLRVNTSRDIPRMSLHSRRAMILGHFSLCEGQIRSSPGWMRGWIIHHISWTCRCYQMITDGVLKEYVEFCKEWAKAPRQPNEDRGMALPIGKNLSISEHYAARLWNLRRLLRWAASSANSKGERRSRHGKDPTNQHDNGNDPKIPNQNKVICSLR